VEVSYRARVSCPSKLMGILQTACGVLLMGARSPIALKQAVPSYSQDKVVSIHPAGDEVSKRSQMAVLEE
jgi:hypothetical protein